MENDSKDQVNFESKISDHTDEIKNGIFNLSISMCQNLSNSVPMQVAKEYTAQWLEEIAKGLRAVQDNPLESN